MPKLKLIGGACPWIVICLRHSRLTMCAPGNRRQQLNDLTCPHACAECASGSDAPGNKIVVAPTPSALTAEADPLFSTVDQLLFVPASSVQASLLRCLNYFLREGLPV